MIVLDTTVLIYAVGAEHPLREPCRRLVGAVAGQQIEARTTVEVVQEFAHVRARRRGREDASALAAAYVDLLSPLIPVERDDVLRGLRLFGSTERLGAFDAVLAAAAIGARAEAIVSADRAFATVADLRHVLPDDAGVDALLR